nr:unnamed protein product [Callosobruchus chinensis]
MAADTSATFFFADPSAGLVVPNGTWALVPSGKTVTEGHFAADGEQYQDGEQQVPFHALLEGLLLKILNINRSLPNSLAAFTPTLKPRAAMATHSASAFFLADPSAGLVVPNGTWALVPSGKTVTEGHFAADGEQYQDGEQQVSFHDGD